jgi:hypothetical protein
MEAAILNFCRAGLDVESIIAVLSAITSRMNADDPACIALDKANDTLMDLQESARTVGAGRQGLQACAVSVASRFDSLIYSTRSNSMKRDLSEEQFRNAAKKEGFAPAFMGYWNLAKPFDNVSVYRFNAGDRRRDQLAYLRAQQKRHLREMEAA